MDSLSQTRAQAKVYTVRFKHNEPYLKDIQELSKNDERLKDIAYVTDWGSYYLVTFEHTKSKRFSLVFKSEKYGNGTFSFAKVAKYIYTNICF